MTEIKLYNTKTRAKEVFTPIDDANVRMYVCGPTVYDRAHIGNARPVVVFDTLFRLLRHVYGHYAVKYVRNFTDVDDKINAKAAATGRPIRDITDETIEWYHEDMDALGALRPTHEPRATEYIAQMIAMIEVLVEKGNAYVSEGHVLFDVNSYDAYGALSGRSLADMRAGERVEIADYKRDPMDFVLWKPSTDDLPGWESPWGYGRPGWHIECSAMSLDLLGDTFDIHGGGIDLQFPHHENEVAQSCCAYPDSGFAKVWMHNGFLQVEGEKMSKSLGNFFTVKDLLEQGIPGEVMRFVLLSTHYRKPIDWTKNKVLDAEKSLIGWKKSIDVFRDEVSKKFMGSNPPSEVINALADDLNTPLVIAELHKLGKQTKAGDVSSAVKLAEALVFLGFDYEHIWEISFGHSLDKLLLPNDDGNAATLIEALLDARISARQNKDFARSDALRDGLAAAGVVVKDTPKGAEWELGADFDAAKLEGLL